MKRCLTAILTVFSYTVFSQVGINTENPNATLDIAAKSSDTSIADGVLIPRITGNDLKAKDNIYGANQNGTLIYVSEIPSPTTSKTSKILDIGFYYYDATQALWSPVIYTEPWNNQDKDSFAKSNSQNIYQIGNVAVGTKFGNGSLHVDGKKDNTTTSASTTQMLNDFLVHPTGRVYIGAKPNDLLLLADVEDKIKVAANVDLDVDYDLATTSNSQAIVHRNIISSGTMDNKRCKRNII